MSDLLEQVEEEHWVREAAAPVDGVHPTVASAVVAVAAGEGVARILRSLGVQAVVEGGQSMNPSVAQLLAAIDSVASDQVIVLPNNKNIVPVARQAAELATKHVQVVPTRGVAEGFAALVAYDADADAATNAVDMTEAAEAVIAGEVTRAVRASSCDLGPIAEGDYLGIARDGIRAVDPDLVSAATTLLGVLLADTHELVTLIAGDGSSDDGTHAITEWLAENHPEVTVDVHHGGQPLYPYLLGIE